MKQSLTEKYLLWNEAQAPIFTCTILLVAKFRSKEKNPSKSTWQTRIRFTTTCQRTYQTYYRGKNEGNLSILSSSLSSSPPHLARRNKRPPLIVEITKETSVRTVSIRPAPVPLGCSIGFGRRRCRSYGGEGEESSPPSRRVNSFAAINLAAACFALPFRGQLSSRALSLRLTRAAR